MFADIITIYVVQAAINIYIYGYDPFKNEVYIHEHLIVTLLTKRFILQGN